MSLRAQPHSSYLCRCSWKVRRPPPSVPIASVTPQLPSSGEVPGCAEQHWCYPGILMCTSCSACMSQIFWRVGLGGRIGRNSLPPLSSLDICPSRKACGATCTPLPCEGSAASTKGLQKDTDSTEIPLSLLGFCQPYLIALQEQRGIFPLLSGVKSSITMSRKKTGCLVAKEKCWL